MLRIASTLFVILSTSVTFGQSVASVDPAASVFDIPKVTSVCTVVATAERAGDETLRGQCIAATTNFMKQEQLGRPGGLDQVVADLVLNLTPLVAADGDCTEFETEVAEAIRIASTYSADPEQIALLQDIAATIEACDPGATAAINPADIGTGPDNSVASNFGG